MVMVVPLALLRLQILLDLRESCLRLGQAAGIQGGSQSGKVLLQHAGTAAGGTGRACRSGRSDRSGAIACVRAGRRTILPHTLQILQQSRVSRLRPGQIAGLQRLRQRLEVLARPILRTRRRSSERSVLEILLHLCVGRLRGRQTAGLQRFLQRRQVCGQRIGRIGSGNAAAGILLRQLDIVLLRSGQIA